MIGAQLSNRYRIDATLGRGGMGVIYRAHDLLLGRDVAVKLLSPAELEGGPGTAGRARLLHEARSAAQLNHPNIVAVYDAGEQDGNAFIVMELVEGETLLAHPPQGLAETLAIARQICAALEHAHGHGVIHRDLKPENVLWSGPAVKLTDFGLARVLTGRISAEGEIAGSVLYLAPEQALGQDVDGRADLYALGVMLYEMAAGRLPFTADDPIAVVSQHLHAPVVPPRTYNPAIPPGLEALIVELLAKRREDRPAQAAAVRRALEEADKLQQVILQCWSLFALVYQDIKAGDWEQALRSCQQAIDLYTPVENRISRLYIGAVYPQALLGAGRVEEAAQSIAQTLAMTGEVQADFFEAIAWRVQGQALAALGREEETMAAFGQAVERLEAQDSRLELARALRERGRLLDRMGESRAAQADLERAGELFEACGAVA